MMHRTLLPDYYYHIYNHANGGDNLFREPENYRYFMMKWRKYIDPIAETIAYCLMPNHFHVLVRIRTQELIVLEMLRRKRIIAQGLSAFSTAEEVMKVLTSTDIDGSLLGCMNDETNKYVIQQFSNLFNGYTKAINKRYKRYGSLFAPTFRRKLVDQYTYLIRLIAYIHANPILHGFVAEYGEWEFSSFSTICEQDFMSSNVSEYFEDVTVFLNYHMEYLKVRLDRGEDFLEF